MDRRDKEIGKQQLTKDFWLQYVDTVSFLVPTCGRIERITEFCERHRHFGLDVLDLLVYDDGSGLSSELRTTVGSVWGGSSQIITSPIREGQCKGRNQLLRNCRTPLAFLFDDDEYLTAVDGLEEAISLMLNSRGDLAVIAFAVRTVQQPDKWMLPLSLADQRLPVFPGGIVLINRELLLKAGGFREELKYGFEEPELSIRLFRSGMRIVYKPSIQMLHNHQDTPEEKRNYSEYEYLYARNAILIDALNFPLPLSLFTGIVRALRRLYLKKGYMSSKFRGILDGIVFVFRSGYARERGTYGDWLRWSRFKKDFAKIRTASDER